MTRKDHIAIAAALNQASAPAWANEIFPTSGEAMRQDIIGRIANVFANDNPRFDRSRFLAACGIESKKAA